VAGLISAIDAANANPDPDTICLAASSTYTLTAVHNTTSGANGLPAITTAITLVGNGATLTRDPAAPAFRLVLVSSSGTLTLENLTLTGGLASGAEPGDDGGGIYNRGTLTLTDSIVTANTANADGGGIYDDGTLTLEGTTDIADNTAGDDGGGIYSAGGTVTVTDAAISGNTAGDQGGGIRSVTSSVTLTNASLTGNSAARRIATFNAWTCSRPYTVRSRSSSGEVGAVIARSTRS
jgi:predicted outer membrane repeat protein